MGAVCNDSRCPLNRRGVPHRPHGDIEGDRVLDPCNDPQCPLTRLGMRHNPHGPMDGPLPDAAAAAAAAGAGPGGEGGAGPRAAGGRGVDGERETADGQAADQAGGNAADRDAGQDAGPGAGGGGAHGGGAAPGPQQPGSPTSPEEILDEAARHLRQHAGRPGADAAEAAAAARQAGRAREAERILGATDPHGILGIPRGATIEQARSSYKSLVKRYDAARGIIHKSPPEREKSNLIMAKINCAFEAFKSARAPGP